MQISNFFLRLDNLSIQKVLKRGFSIVRDFKQKKILKSSSIKNEKLIDIEFHDGIIVAKILKK